MNYLIALVAALTLDAPFGSFKIAETSFPERDFAITDFGAKPGGAKCTEAFAAAPQPRPSPHAPAPHPVQPLRLQRHVRGRIRCASLHDKEVADALGVRCVLCGQGSHAAWRLRAVAPTGATLLDALDIALAPC